MGKIDKNNFKYLGKEFQYRLVLQVLSDSKFTESIIDILDPNYFGDSDLREIVGIVKEGYEKDESILDMDVVEMQFLSRNDTELQRKLSLEVLHEVKTAGRLRK